MNCVRSAVSQYDTELPIALSTLKRRLQSTKKQKSNANELVWVEEIWKG